MAIVMIFNTAGGYATAITSYTGTIASGIDKTKIIAGPRHEAFRWQATTGNLDMGYYYGGTIRLNHEYVVVCRADWLLLHDGGSRIRVTEINTSNTPQINTSGPDINPLATSNLVGPRSQDLVMTCGPSSATWNYGAGLNVDPNSALSTAAQFSKLIIGGGITLGSEPLPGSYQSEEVPPSARFFTPLDGHGTYEVELAFSLSWAHVTTATLDAFRTLFPDIRFRWPLYLYDTTGDVIPWQGEHCLISQWTETFVNVDQWNVTIRFLRLKHYD